jgi:uncharacterized membrane protein YfhO
LTDSSGRVPPIYYDYEYRSAARGSATGELARSSQTGLSRFRWSYDSSRKIAVKDETLTKLTLTLEPGKAGDLIRTDSYYPGWRAFTASGELKVEFEPPCFMRITIPPDTSEVRFLYQPRSWRTSLWIAALAAVALWFLMAKILYKRRRPHDTAAIN